VKRRVALLHTSFVLFEGDRFLFKLFDEMLPDVELLNIVEDKMIQDVIAKGHVTPEVTRRVCHYVLAAAAMGVDAIFNTCTSTGPAFDVAANLTSIPTVRIDDGVTEQAARQGERIGVLATVPSALRPTTELIDRKAKALGRQVAIREALSEGAFGLLRKGDVRGHDEMVIRTAREIAQWADILVLAQVTMAALAPRLSQEVGLPVLTNLRSGVEQLKRVLDSLS
jgi:Asp/Glu/hydantoin racemase